MANISFSYCPEHHLVEYGMRRIYSRRMQVSAALTKRGLLLGAVGCICVWKLKCASDARVSDVVDGARPPQAK